MHDPHMIAQNSYHNDLARAARPRKLRPYRTPRQRAVQSTLRTLAVLCVAGSLIGVFPFGA